MAQPAPKAWGASAGAWADDVATEEAQSGPLVAPATVNEAAFPSLAQAKDVPAAKGKKAKGQKMNLHQFQGTAAPFRAQGAPKVSDEQIRATLPTGSRGKVEGEDPNALGGGFKDYGGERGGRDQGERRERGGFGSRGGDDEGRGERSGFGFESKADEEGVWSKTFTPSQPSERRGFGGGGFGGDRERSGPDGGGGGDAESRGPSAADTSNNWGAERKFEPGPPAGRSGGAFGGDRRDERGAAGGGERERGSSSFALSSKADEEDQWSRGRAMQTGPADIPGGARPGAAEGRKGGFGFAGGAAEGEDRWARRPSDTPSSAAPATAPGDRPRLALAPRTKPIEPIVVQKDEAAAAEGSATAAEPAAAAPAGPPKPKANPFGAARPREEVLKEKGLGDDSKAKPDVAVLRQEVADLRRRLEALNAAATSNGDASVDEAAAPAAALAADEEEATANDEGAAAEGASKDSSKASAGSDSAKAASKESAIRLQVELEAKEKVLAAAEATASAAEPEKPAEKPKGLWARAAAAEPTPPPAASDATSPAAGAAERSKW